MALLAELTTEFPWGIALVSDSGSRELIPEWSSPEDPVAVGREGLVVRVLHGQEGPATIRVWDEPFEIEGEQIFDGTLMIGSGMVRVSDALQENAADLAVQAGQHEVKIYADSPLQGELIDILIF